MTQRAILLKTGDIVKVSDESYTRIVKRFQPGINVKIPIDRESVKDTSRQSHIISSAIAMLIGDLAAYFPDEADGVEFAVEGNEEERIETVDPPDNDSEDESDDSDKTDDPGDDERKAKVKKVFNKHIAKVTRGMLLKHLDFEDEGQKKNDLIDLL